MLGLPPFRMLAPIDNRPNRSKLQAVAACHLSKVRIFLEDAAITPTAYGPVALASDHHRGVLVELKDSSQVSSNRQGILDDPAQPLGGGDHSSCWRHDVLPRASGFR